MNENARRVMVIDDEGMIRRVMTTILDQAGFEVTGHAAVQTALAQIESGERFDAILCDVNMPEMSGVEFFRALLQHHPDQAAHVGLITGDLSNPELRDLLPMLYVEPMRKPFSREGLCNYVRTLARLPHQGSEGTAQQ